MQRVLVTSQALGFVCFVAATVVFGAEPEIDSVRRIWDRSEHNAFTDLIRFGDRSWCTFREAKDHGGSVGKVRVIVSDDGDEWQSDALIEQRPTDLRDPKLSITPDDRPMSTMGGSVYEGTHRKTSPVRENCAHLTPRKLPNRPQQRLSPGEAVKDASEFTKR